MKFLLPLMVVLSLATVSCSHGSKKACCGDKAKCTEGHCDMKKDKKEKCDKCGDKSEVKAEKKEEKKK